MNKEKVTIIESRNVKTGQAFFLTKRVYDKAMSGQELDEDDLKEAVLLNNIATTN